MRHQPNCYYCTLSATPSGSVRDVRVAHFAASRLSHPDRLPAAAAETAEYECAKLFHDVALHYMMGWWWRWRTDAQRMVYEAYLCLSDPENRKEYEGRCGFDGVKGVAWDLGEYLLTYFVGSFVGRGADQHAVEHERAKYAERMEAAAQKRGRKARGDVRNRAMGEQGVLEAGVAEESPSTRAEETDEREEQRQQREAVEIGKREEEMRVKKQQATENVSVKVEEELTEEARRKEQEELGRLGRFFSESQRVSTAAEPQEREGEIFKKEEDTSGDGDDGEDTDEDGGGDTDGDEDTDEDYSDEDTGDEYDEGDDEHTGGDDEEATNEQERMEKAALRMRGWRAAEGAEQARAALAEHDRRELIKAEKERQREREKKKREREQQVITPFRSDLLSTKHKNRSRRQCPPNTSSNIRWSAEEVEYMQSQRAAGLSWYQVAVKVNCKFGTSRSVRACSSKHYKS